MATVTIVAALVRTESDVLLVRKQGPDNTGAVWALPGGVMEAGETLSETLVRGVFEETGLVLTDPGQLLYITQIDRPFGIRATPGDVPRPGDQSFVFVFEPAGWIGNPQTVDPDAPAAHAAFRPFAEAILVLERLPWSRLREPVLAALRGEVGPGAIWLYRMDADGSDTLLPPSPFAGRQEEM